MRPPSSNTMRSAYCPARSNSWVVTTTPCPSRAARASKSKTCKRCSGSSALVGSSAKSNGAPCAKARATNTRRRAPPDNVPSVAHAASAASQAARAACVAARSASGAARQRGKRAYRPAKTKSKTNTSSRGGNSCGTKAARSARARGSSCRQSTPPRVARPWRKGNSPAKARSKVLLPAPFLPNTTNNSPARTSRSRPAKTLAAPSSQAHSACSSVAKQPADTVLTAT